MGSFSPHRVSRARPLGGGWGGWVRHRNLQADSLIYLLKALILASVRPKEKEAVPFDEKVCPQTSTRTSAPWLGGGPASPPYDPRADAQISDHMARSCAAAAAASWPSSAWTW
jgi:hypothetical protein